MKKVIIMFLLVFVNFIFGQDKNNTTILTNNKAQKDSLLTVTEKEINQAMQFGRKEKITAIATGSFGGAIVGFFIGRTLTYTKIDPLDQTGGILLGMTAGIIIGPIINYSLTYHAIRHDTKKQLIESKKKERH